MGNVIVSASLLALGVIHLLPLIGVLGVDRLNELYGVTIQDRDLELLMRHRAVLFGMLGGLLFASVFVASLRSVAFCLAFVSVSSFLVLAWSMGKLGAEVQTVFWVDVVALVVLAVGVFFYFSKSDVSESAG
ncbi:MAG: phosphopantetheine adenylyltransferase [Pseudomonadota bacterium]